MNADPHWREVTTDDYHPRIYLDAIDEDAWIASIELVRQLLRDQHNGLYRMRLVLRDAVDHASRANHEPDWFWDYATGPTLVLSFAGIVIERKGGQRDRVEL